MLLPPHPGGASRQSTRVTADACRQRDERTVRRLRAADRHSCASIYTPQTEVDHVGVFQGLIAKLDEDELIHLAERTNMGELGLSALVDMLRLVRGELEAAEGLPYEEIPLGVRQEILGQNFRSTLDDVLHRMLAYGPNLSNPRAERDDIADRVESLRDRVIERVRPIVRHDGGPARDLFMQAEEALARISTETKALAEKQDEIRTLAHELALQQAALSVASAVTVSEDLSPHYRKQASEHGKAAGRLLVASVIVGILFGAATALALFKYPPDYSSDGTSEQWIEFVRGAVGRITLLSLVALALSFCLRNYRVNRHLEVVNKRRENALNTFGLLQSAVTTDDARNLVVAELVRSVFGSEDTGYLSGQPDRTVIESPSGAGILSTMTASRGGGSPT